MFLSCLLVDVGDNPDRPRPGRLWLRNVYRVHQRLCMAFPSAVRAARDEDFLEPFRPEDFPEFSATGGPRQVQTRRGPEGGFLFRIDVQSAGRVVVLVQSAVEPNWGYAFHNASHLLAAAPETKPFEPCFAAGQRLRFRLVANPTRKISTDDENRPNGTRVPVPAERLVEWLATRAQPAGFTLDDGTTTVQAGYLYGTKGQAGGKPISLRCARYDGTLCVADSGRFRETLIRGIGPAKAFGCGLLSVARVTP